MKNKAFLIKPTLLLMLMALTSNCRIDPKTTVWYDSIAETQFGETVHFQAKKYYNRNKEHHDILVVKTPEEYTMINTIGKVKLVKNKVKPKPNYTVINRISYETPNFRTNKYILDSTVQISSLTKIKYIMYINSDTTKHIFILNPSLVSRQL
jgi:hypothetical protein